jgi:hypothetical protein
LANFPPKKKGSIKQNIPSSYLSFVLDLAGKKRKKEKKKKKYLLGCAVLIWPERHATKKH